MSEKVARLKILKSELAVIEHPARGYWKHTHGVPIPKGCVAELIGNAKTEWLLKFLVENDKEKVLWCEREQIINPTALFQRGLNLSRVKFVTSDGDFQKPLRSALESQGYSFVVVPTMTKEVRVFQRLQHLAEKAHATVFLMAKENTSTAWPISLQLQIDRDELGIKTTVLRQKFGVGACE